MNAVRSGAETGNFVDGPGAWDGYAAAAVCAAGVQALETGERVAVAMVDRASIAGAEPAQRPENTGAEPAQRPENTGAEPAQRPENTGAEPAQRPENTGA